MSEKSVQKKIKEFQRLLAQNYPHVTVQVDMEARIDSHDPTVKLDATKRSPLDKTDFAAERDDANLGVPLY